jgi:hypothetical protein
MAQRRLLSGSSGTFWGVVGEGEWSGPLLLKNATKVRTQNKLGTPQDIISSSGSSDDGLVNTVTLRDVSSAYNGSSVGCAYYGFPLTKEDGSPLDLGADHFTIDFFLEITNSPTQTENNKCFLFVGINDGDTDLDATMGAGFAYDITTQRNTVFSTGGSRTNKNCATVGFPYTRATMTTAPSGSNTFGNPFIGIMAYGYDGDDNDQIADRILVGDTMYGTKYQSTGLPIGSQAYVYVALGRTATGAGEKTFSFKAYYKLSLHTRNGVPTERPG